jgi:hypothetical protein
VHTYWDDNDGRNYKLAKNGGTILNGVKVLMKSAKWSLDTVDIADSTIFSGEVEVRGWKPGNVLRIAYTTDFLKTQDVKPIDGPPTLVSHGNGSTADSDQVYLYKFRYTGVKLPVSTDPHIQFNLIYITGNGAYYDTNLFHSYALELGWSVDNLSDDLRPATLGRSDYRRPSHVVGKAYLKISPSPLFPAGARGRVDGMGRVR